MKKILILIFITLINTMTANASTKINFDMLSEMKPQEAYQLALPLAKDGDGVAQAIIGDLYKNGKALPKDIEKAKKWMNESYNNLLPLAKDGNAEAQYIIGKFYDDKDSLVLPYNNEKALFWYEKAANQNYTSAITSIINIYSGIQLDSMMNNKPLSEEIEKKLFYWNKYGAERNIVSCQDSLANAYMQGKGTQKDIDKAEDWYKKAFDGFIKLAKGGDESAMSSLVKKYHTGEGIEKDEELAIFWFNKITEDINKQIALMSLTGSYFPNNEKTYNSEVFYWNKRAAELGDKNAQINLSFMYKNGNGVEKDLDKAFFWLNKAVTNDESFSSFTFLAYKVDEYYSLALMYFLGEGTEKNNSKAIPLLKKSALNNNPNAYYILGYIYEDEKDMVKAAQAYSKGCELNDSSSCVNSAILFTIGNGVERDYFKAVELYKKAIKLGEDPLAYRNLGYCYAKGMGIEQNNIKADQMFEKACSLDAKMCLHIAESYANGNFVTKNLNKAKEFYGKACDLKNNEGCEKYATLKSTTENNPSYSVYNISGNGEECSATFTQDGKLHKTTCLSLTNSKGIKILCTKNKKICKTEDELTGSLPQNTETDTTATSTAMCTSRNGNLGTLRLTQSADGSLMRVENISKGTDLGLFELGTSKGGDPRYYGSSASVYIYQNHKAISIRGSDTKGGNHTGILGVWDCTPIKWR